MNEAGKGQPALPAEKIKVPPNRFPVSKGTGFRMIRAWKKDRLGGCWPGWWVG